MKHDRVLALKAEKETIFTNPQLMQSVSKIILVWRKILTLWPGTLDPHPSSAPYLAV